MCDDKEIFEVMLKHKTGRLSLRSLDDNILQKIPLWYLESHAHTTELHHIWEKLPISYRESPLLLQKLPCCNLNNKIFYMKMQYKM